VKDVLLLDQLNWVAEVAAVGGCPKCKPERVEWVPSLSPMRLLREKELSQRYVTPYYQSVIDGSTENRLFVLMGSNPFPLVEQLFMKRTRREVSSKGEKETAENILDGVRTDFLTREWKEVKGQNKCFAFNALS